MTCSCWKATNFIREVYHELGPVDPVRAKLGPVDPSWIGTGWAYDASVTAKEIVPAGRYAD